MQHDEGSTFKMPDYKVKLDELGHMVGFDLAGDLYHSDLSMSHAEASVFEMPDYKVKLDELGHMVGFELAGDLYHSFEDLDDFLAHYGVKGMHWGVRKEAESLGVPHKTAATAKKDAEEFTRAKMFYGEGAGTRRKLIKAKVEQRMSDPQYKKAFDHFTNRTDLAKRSDQARGERRRKDISNSTRKTARGVKNVLVGNPRNATIAALAVAGVAQEAHARGIDTKVLNLGKEAVRNVLASVKHDALEDFEDFELDLDSLAHLSNEELEDFLEHFGVKGMHWGVRKSESGSSKPRGAIRRGATKANVALDAGAKVIKEGEKKLIFLPQKNRNQAAARTQTQVLAKAAALNRSPEFKGKDIKHNPTLRDSYFKQIEESAKTTYAQELGISRTEAWGDVLGVDMRATTNQMRINAVADRIRHAADGPEMETLVEFNFVTNELGHIVDIKIPEKYLAQSDDFEDALAHYGVKGMRWGVRKDESGSAGTVGSSPISEDHARAVAALTKAQHHGLSALSTKEMRELTSRLEVERKFNQLSAERAKATRSTGRKVIDALLGDVGEVVTQEASNLGKKYVRETLRKQAESKSQTPAPKAKPVNNLDEVLKPYSNRR
jgi:hypothetical protein